MQMSEAERKAFDHWWETCTPPFGADASFIAGRRSRDAEIRAVVEAFDGSRNMSIELWYALDALKGATDGR